MRKILHYLILGLLLVSYILILFNALFIKDFFRPLLFFFGAILLFVVSVILFVLYLYMHFNEFRKTWIYFLAFFILIAGFIPCFIVVNQNENYLYLQVREPELNEFVKEIQDYKKIQYMSDGQRFYKSINKKLIEFDKNKVREKENVLFYKDVLKNEGLNLNVYNKFRKKLIWLGLIDFELLKDNSVIFTFDGLLDNSWGIAYSKSGTEPETVRNGTIQFWSKIIKNWYRWGI